VDLNNRKLPIVNVLYFRTESGEELNCSNIESFDFDFVGKPDGTEIMYGKFSRFVDFNAGYRTRNTNRI